MVKGTQFKNQKNFFKIPEKSMQNITNSIDIPKRNLYNKDNSNTITQIRYEKEIFSYDLRILF